jgi:uncharacterized membrane protein YkoI
MDAKLLIAMIALLAGGVLRAEDQDQRITADELPPAVRRALDESARGAPVKYIVRRTIDGQMVYDVEVERENAINPRFRITQDGLVMTQSSSSATLPIAPTPLPYSSVVPPPLPFDPGITISQLPAAVKEAIKREAAGRPIAEIDRETWRGRTVYEVEFKTSGPNPQVHIAEDGTLVLPDQPTATQVGEALKNLLLGTQLEDTPAAVQQTIRHEAGDATITDIDVKRRKGERIYEVEINDRQNVFLLQVAEDGRVLYNTRPSAPPLKRG